LTGIREYRDGVNAFSHNARLFVTGGLLNGLGMSAFGLLFNLYLKERGFTETQIGGVLAMGSLGAAIAAIPAALLLEKVGTRVVLIWSTILAGICYAMQILFRSYQFLQLFSFAGVMFVTFYRIATAPFLMANSTGRERIYLFSVGSAATMFSSLIGFMVGGFLPGAVMAVGLTHTVAGSQEAALYISVAAGMLSVIPFLGITPAPPCGTGNGRSGFLHRLKSYNWPVIWRLIAPKIFVGLGAGLVIPFMNLYFRNEFGLDSGRIGVFFSMMQIGLFLGMLGAPILMKRFGMVNSIVITELLSVPFMLILALTRDLPLAVAAFILRGTLMNLSLPISSNFEMELVPEADRPFTNAISSISWNGSWTLSAALGGAIIEKFSFAYSFYLTIVLYLLSAVSYYLLLGRGRLPLPAGTSDPDEDIESETKSS